MNASVLIGYNRVSDESPPDAYVQYELLHYSSHMPLQDVSMIWLQILRPFYTHFLDEYGIILHSNSFVDCLY